VVLAANAEGCVRDALANVAAFPLYVAGWLAGVVVRFLAWCRDAIVVGYRDGRGDR
jgi:hypothetical protein